MDKSHPILANSITFGQTFSSPLNSKGREGVWSGEL
jgi:hypothetical protein